MSGYRNRIVTFSYRRIVTKNVCPEGEFALRAELTLARPAVSQFTVVRRCRVLNQARSEKLRIALLNFAGIGSNEPGMYLPVH